ncbi:hypothetical protein BV898_00361 [Hypsibius exemplaris]|uniref:MADF domain-containing protein n=1 Tax=Hypsibius exemplaris TaxID=2072580 RepID=A0A1W0XFJ4_HYPEX|nr:hypothetical protein BV898_00361 [Hypsibius exemplaris]
MARKWSDTEVEQFAHQLQEVECLWKRTSDEYRLKDRKEDAWNVMEVSMNRTAEECKKKYETLRGQLSRALAKPPSDDGGKAKKEWAKLNLFLFMKDQIEPRAALGNVTVIEARNEAPSSIDQTKLHSPGGSQTFAEAAASANGKGTPGKGKKRQLEGAIFDLLAYIKTKTQGSDEPSPKRSKLQDFGMNVADRLSLFPKDMQELHMQKITGYIVTAEYNRYKDNYSASDFEY